LLEFINRRGAMKIPVHPDPFCTICGAGELRLKFVKNGHDILQCKLCGVGHALARDFDPARYYTRAYFEGDTDDGYANYGQSEAVLRGEFAGLARKLSEEAPTGGPLLEIGCAYGFFLKEAQRYWEVYGLEISTEAVDHCLASGLSNVRQGLAETAYFKELPQLQAVVMLDVIEHLPDPVGVLAACREKLIPGGVLLVTTGDFGSFFARLLGSRWRLMTPPQHLWFFTSAGFRYLARIQDWEVLHLAHPGKRVPLSLIIYQFRRMLGLKPRASLSGAQIGIPINLGDSMMLVLQRPA
jgi:SAM-dependent methyltransferase